MVHARCICSTYLMHTRYNVGYVPHLNGTYTYTRYVCGTYRVTHNVFQRREEEDRYYATLYTSNSRSPQGIQARILNPLSTYPLNPTARTLPLSVLQNSVTHLLEILQPLCCADGLAHPHLCPRLCPRLRPCLCLCSSRVVYSMQRLSQCDQGPGLQPCQGACVHQLLHHSLDLTAHAHGIT